MRNVTIRMNRMKALISDTDYRTETMTVLPVDTERVSTATVNMEAVGIEAVGKEAEKDLLIRYVINLLHQVMSWTKVDRTISNKLFTG